MHWVCSFRELEYSTGKIHLPQNATCLEFPLRLQRGLSFKFLRQQLQILILKSAAQPSLWSRLKRPFVNSRHWWLAQPSLSSQISQSRPELSSTVEHHKDSVHQLCSNGSSWHTQATVEVVKSPHTHKYCSVSTPCKLAYLPFPTSIHTRASLGPWASWGVTACSILFFFDLSFYTSTPLFPWKPHA